MSPVALGPWITDITLVDCQPEPPVCSGPVVISWLLHIIGVRKLCLFWNSLKPEALLHTFISPVLRSTCLCAIPSRFTWPSGSCFLSNSRLPSGPHMFAVHWCSLVYLHVPSIPPPKKHSSSDLDDYFGFKTTNFAERWVTFMPDQLHVDFLFGA